MKNKTIWVLEYTFHQYNISGEETKTIERKLNFYTIEDLLKVYREKVNATFCGVIKYNTDFHIYRGLLEEYDINLVNNLLDMN